MSKIGSRSRPVEVVHVKNFRSTELYIHCNIKAVRKNVILCSYSTNSTLIVPIDRPLKSATGPYTNDTRLPPIYFDIDKTSSN